MLERAKFIFIRETSAQSGVIGAKISFDPTDPYACIVSVFGGRTKQNRFALDVGTLVLFHINKKVFGYSFLNEIFPNTYQ